MYIFQNKQDQIVFFSTYDCPTIILTKPAFVELLNARYLLMLLAIGIAGTCPGGLVSGERH
jgi:hypothetical protein